MYQKGLKVKIASREEIEGVPLERLDLPMDEHRKNVLLVLRVAATCDEEDIKIANEWLGEQCERMSGNMAAYHGVVLLDTVDWVLDVVEVETEVSP